MLIKRIPILMYHSIEPKGSGRIYDNEEFYNVTPENFRKQLAFLRGRGFKTITLNDFIRSEKDDDLPRNAIMLTFDDGHISHYEAALPLLKEFGFSGVFFLVVNAVGKKYRVSWENARELKKAGMEIGSHGMNHTILNKASYFDLIVEMKSSKIMLEDNLKAQILAFSIPRGLYSGKISEVARGMGYKLVFTSFTGNASLYSDPYRIKRTVIRSTYSIKDFISIIKKDPVFIMRLYAEEFAKNSVRGLLGVRGYDRIKRTIFTRHCKGAKHYSRHCEEHRRSFSRHCEEHRRSRCDEAIPEIASGAEFTLSEVERRPRNDGGKCG